MIAYLKGKVIFKQAPMIILDVNGVGYELWAPMSTYYNLPQTSEQTTELFCYQYIREDSNSLYGFASLEQRKLFMALLKTNGVGPRLALTILSNYDTAEFIRIIANCDHASLIRLPGVGQKTAERLLLELKDRLNKIFNPNELNGFQSTADYQGNQSSDADLTVSDAIEALEALGYKANDVRKVITKLVKGHNSFTSETLIKAALQEFR